MKKVLSVSLVFLLLMSCSTLGITVVTPEKLREEQIAKEVETTEKTVFETTAEEISIADTEEHNESEPEPVSESVSEPVSESVTDIAQVDFSDYQPTVEIVPKQQPKEESPKKETVVNVTVNEDKTQPAETIETVQESSNTGIIILAAVIITAVVCAVLYLFARKRSKKNNERLPE